MSYNLRGLHSPIQRKKVFDQLRRAGCQVAFLQETHLSDKEHEKLKRSWAGRGVSILIHRSINFIATATHTDAVGRYILVNGALDGMEVSLMNIYAPNEDAPVFIKTVFNCLLRHSNETLLMGRDFNCVMSQSLDRYIQWLIWASLKLRLPVMWFLNVTVFNCFLFLCIFPRLQGWGWCVDGAISLNSNIHVSRSKSTSWYKDMRIMQITILH